MQNTEEVGLCLSKGTFRETPELSPLPSGTAPVFDPITAAQDRIPDQKSASPSKQRPSLLNRILNQGFGSGRCLKLHKRDIVARACIKLASFPRDHSPLRCERGNDEP